MDARAHGHLAHGAPWFKRPQVVPARAHPPQGLPAWCGTRTQKRTAAVQCGSGSWRRRRRLRQRRPGLQDLRRQAPALAPQRRWSATSWTNSRQTVECRGRPGLGSAYRSVRKCILHQKAIAGVCKDAAQGVGRAASASAKSEKSEKLELEGTASANKEHQLRRMKRKRHTMDGAVKARVKLRVHLSARAHASSAAFQCAFA